MSGKRSSVFAVTENGETRYCVSKIYGGLAGAALRLCLNAVDERGNTRPLFERFDRVLEISEADWRRISGDQNLYDDYYSYIEIDADANAVRVDENWHREKERRCAEVPLNKLLEVAGLLIESNRYSGYPSLDKSKLYTRIRKHFTRSESYRNEEERKPFLISIDSFSSST